MLELPPSNGAGISLARLAAERALAELVGAHAKDLGDAHQAEYTDAVLRVGAIRWAAVTPVSQPGPLILSASSGEPGQTCVALELAHREHTAPLLRRCTYGIVWLASAQAISQGLSRASNEGHKWSGAANEHGARDHALVVAVQPLESWRELWVFHETAGTWMVDVISPGANDPEEGYVEFAGFAPGTRRLLIVRELKERNRFRRWFEELRLDDLALVRQASTPELLRDFGRWQDVAWRRDTLALR